MKLTGIYGIRNKVSGKFYVGQSIDIHRRWTKHKAAALRPSGKTALLDALRAYGADGFDFIVIEECVESELNERERHWIAKLDAMANGYNHLDGGGQGPRLLRDDTRERFRAAQLGKKASAETREKISRSSKGRRPTDETRAKMSAAMKGRVFSPEWCARISAAKSNPSPAARANNARGQRARIWTEETKRRMSESAKGSIKSPEHRAAISAAMKGNRNKAKYLESQKK
jgi:group I intron endonuclease